jgi:hypothetical protein
MWVALGPTIFLRISGSGVAWISPGVSMPLRFEVGALFACLVLWFAVTAPVTQPAQAGQPVNQPYTCPAGSFLTGLQGRAGDWLDQFQPVCRSWTPAGGSGATETFGDNFGNINGGNRAVRSVCAVGSAIYAIMYDIASPNGPPGHVQKVTVGCVKLPYFNANVDVGLDGQAGTRGSVLNFCKNGQIAKGLTIGLDGINITSASPICDTVDDIIGAPGSTSTPCAPHLQLFHGQCVTPCPYGPRLDSGICPPALKIIRCPDGSTVSPGRACPQPHIDLRHYRCPDGTFRLPDGSCPSQPKGHKIILLPHNGIGQQPPCPDNQPRQQDGSCPTTYLHVSPSILRKLNEGTSSGLH